MVKKKSKLETGVRLPSSKEIFGLCESFDENVLGDLLKDAWKKKLPLDTKIIVTSRKVDYDNMPGDCDDPEPFLIYVEEIETLRNLHETYERCHGRKYTPEGEEERISFKMAVMEKQAERRGGWGGYMQTMNAIRVAEEEEEAFEEGGEEALEKLREKKSKGARWLYIG